ncbi:hypothetical protein [Thermococcus sp.]
MIRELKRDLVDYIERTTGIDKETIVKVLRAEESFLLQQIDEALGNSGESGF